MVEGCAGRVVGKDVAFGGETLQGSRPRFGDHAAVSIVTGEFPKIISPPEPIVRFVAPTFRARPGNPKLLIRINELTVVACSSVVVVPGVSVRTSLTAVWLPAEFVVIKFVFSMTPPAGV